MPASPEPRRRPDAEGVPIEPVSLAIGPDMGVFDDPTIGFGEKAPDPILGREPPPPAVFKGSERRFGADG